jgi:hypothetical protein
LSSNRDEREARGLHAERDPDVAARGLHTERDPREARGLREERARAALMPLAAHERPAPLLVATAVAGLLAIAVAVGVASEHDLRSHGGSVLGGLFLALVLAALAVGMYRRLYWAVLGFEALLAFQVIVASLALVVASTILAAALCLASIVLGGWLFWKLVRVMGRIQAGERRVDEPLR